MTIQRLINCFCLMFFLLPLAAAPALQDDSMEVTSSITRMLEYPVVHGNLQHQKVRSWLDQPIVARLTDENGRPMPGDTVYFRLLSFPEKTEGFRLLNDMVVTDSAGLASTQVRLGSVEGDANIE